MAWTLIVAQCSIFRSSYRLLQFYTCHELGSSGAWLEASYSVRCRDKDGKMDDTYGAYVYTTGLAAAFYSIGVPLMFFWVVRAFQDRGKRGDMVVRGAIGWMCTLLHRHNSRENWNLL